MQTYIVHGSASCLEPMVFSFTHPALFMDGILSGKPQVRMISGYCEGGKGFDSLDIIILILWFKDFRVKGKGEITAEEEDQEFQ